MNDSPVTVLAPLPAPFRRLSRRPWSLTTPMLLLALAAGATAPGLLRAGDAPSRVVPSAFVADDVHQLQLPKHRRNQLIRLPQPPPPFDRHGYRLPIGKPEADEDVSHGVEPRHRRDDVVHRVELR